jgi:hypothetical protein
MFAESSVACGGVTGAKAKRGTLWVLKPAHRTKVFPTALIIAIDPSSNESNPVTQLTIDLRA